MEKAARKPRLKEMSDLPRREGGWELLIISPASEKFGIRDNFLTYNEEKFSNLLNAIMKLDFIHVGNMVFNNKHDDMELDHFLNEEDYPYSPFRDLDYANKPWFPKYEYKGCGGRLYIAIGQGIPNHRDGKRSEQYLVCRKCGTINPIPGTNYKALINDETEFRNAIFYLMLKQANPHLKVFNFINCSTCIPLAVTPSVAYETIKEMGLIAVCKDYFLNAYGIGFTLLPGLNTLEDGGVLAEWYKFLEVQERERAYNALKGLQKTLFPS